MMNFHVIKDLTMVFSLKKMELCWKTGLRIITYISVFYYYLYLCHWVIFFIFLHFTRYVIPYNPSLLTRYHSHINVEWCNQARSIKYLFKYINKEHERVIVTFYSENRQNIDSQERDKIKMFYDCWYLSPSESIWRIFGWYQFLWSCSLEIELSSP